jgi:transcriptional regulator with XRE-family HTH domain
MANVNSVIASTIRAERVRRGLRQDELGRRLGWPRTRLSDVESGRRAVRVDDLPAICRALEIPFSELISRAEPHDWLALTGVTLPS